MNGTAIIAALLVVALVTALGSKLLMTQEIWIVQVQARNNLDVSRESVLASLHWARAVLYDDSSRSQVDHDGEAWARPMPITTVGDATVSGSLEDEQGKFDVNSLVQEGKVNAAAVSSFSRLLALLGLPESLAGSLADWIDADDEPTGADGAERAYYAARTPPYRAANALIGSLEELMYVRGFDASVVQTLKPFVTALPAPMTINANTASPEVLSAAIPGLPLAFARQLVNDRKTQHFTTTDELKSRLTPAMQEVFQGIGVQSQFFLAHGEVKAGANDEQTVYRITTLLQRKDKKWPLVVWQRPE